MNFSESARDLLTSISSSLTSIAAALQSGIVISSTKSFDHGSNLDIGITAERLTTLDFPCKNGITIKAGTGNAGVVYAGRIGVTAETNRNTDGFPLYATDSVTIEVENVNQIYVIGSQANQICFWIAS